MSVCTVELTGGKELNVGRGTLGELVELLISVVADGMQMKLMEVVKESVTVVVCGGF